MRGTLGDIDPLNTVPFKSAIKKGSEGSPLKGSPYYCLGVEEAFGLTGGG